MNNFYKSLLFVGVALNLTNVAQAGALGRSTLPIITLGKRCYSEISLKNQADIIAPLTVLSQDHLSVSCEHYAGLSLQNCRELVDRTTERYMQEGDNMIIPDLTKPYNVIMVGKNQQGDITRRTIVGACPTRYSDAFTFISTTEELNKPLTSFDFGNMTAMLMQLGFK